MNFARRRAALAALGTVMLAVWASTAWAQVDRPVKMVLPNATGSGVVAITRAAQPALAAGPGHPVIVDNQPGATARHMPYKGVGPWSPT